MKRPKLLTFFTLICCLCGVLFYLIQRHWLIVQFTFSPAHIATVSTSPKAAPDHKTVKISYWKGEKWHHEEAKIIWDPNNIALSIRQLVKQWLTTLQDEHLISQYITLESITLSSTGNEAYLSFDHNFFSPEWSIIQKWRIIESLIKTLRNAEIQLLTIMLLVHHQPMHDEHLDFSQPLPVQERL